ncbi:MAG: Asp-tRNA(Asn)/Glu-tRNA(Gln) amidotransferase subunit GatC [Candidatus Babeliales bacterium]
MSKLTREELLKIAYISRLELYDAEVPALHQHLSDVLTYAERVNDLAREVTLATGKNINVFREDVVESTNSEPILERAPEREENFFVVPRIIEQE